MADQQSMQVAARMRFVSKMQAFRESVEALPEAGLSAGDMARWERLLRQKLAEVELAGHAYQSALSANR